MIQMLKIKRTLFIQRKIIEKEFLKWAEQNGVANTPNNVIAYLDMNRLLNMNKIVKFLEKVE